MGYLCCIFAVDFNENDNEDENPKVRANEQESSVLELLPRAQPKLNNEIVKHYTNL